MTEQLTKIENASIRQFVQSAADDGCFSGRVLDYGCGHSPYRSIVEGAGGEYHGYDRAGLPANQSGDVGDFDPADEEWDTILCTQVVQYLPQGWWLAWHPFFRVREGGYLVLTYPTNWPEVQEVDLHRFTKAGMERLLIEAGFEIVRHECRAVVVATNATGDEPLAELALGYGVICLA